MTLRLTEEEMEALRRLAEVEGISMHEAARCAVRGCLARVGHRDRFEAATGRVLGVHGFAFERVG